MENIIWLIAYFAVLIIFYSVILFRKRERGIMKLSLKSQDWVFFFALIFGGVVLAQLVFDLGVDLPVSVMMGILIAFFCVLLVAGLISRRKTGRPLVRLMGDERTNVIFSKSSRNALFVTYLVLFLNREISDTAGLDATWLLIMLGSGILVLLVSVLFYNYRTV